MEYATTNEKAEKWRITSQRMTKLRNEGRVEGAGRSRVYKL